MEKFRVFLLDEGVNRPEEALLKAAEFEVLEVENEEFEEAWLFFMETPTPPPDWAATLAEIVGGVRVSGGMSHRAILFIRSQDRWFALTFGYGYRSLDAAAFEQNFGFRVAMNCLDEEHIKSIGSHVLGIQSMKLSRTFAADGRLDDFGLGYYDEFLRRVEAKPLDTEFGARIDGAHSLEIKRDALPEDWNEFFAKIMEYFASNKIHDRMPFFDRFTMVTDPQTKKFLEEQLVSDVLGEVQMEMWPQFEREAPEQVMGYRFVTDQGPERIREYVPTIDDYRALYEARRAVISRPRLVKDRLEAVGDNDEVLGSWPIRHCIDYYFESPSEEQSPRTYFLEGGTWFLAKHNYLDELNDRLAGFLCTNLTLPAAPKGVTETKYNSDTAKAMKWALMDADNVTLKGETPIEVCDLYTGKKQLIHVKRLQGSKFTSYVLHQVGTSCQLLASHAPFAREFAKKLRAKKREELAKFVDPPFNTEQHHVVVALMVKPGTKYPQDLPLLLRLRIERLMKEVGDDYRFTPCMTLVERPE